MLEKLDSQNVAACENQGEQCELSNANWAITENLLERFWKNITGNDTKNPKRLTEMQALTKEFTSYNIRYKSLRK